jgi:type IV fimbrial biogenesis protein FimT
MRRTTHQSGLSAGFTLVEFLVTVVVIGLVLTIAVPSFNEVIRSNRLSGQYNDFLTALSLTRSEAVKRGQIVTLCASANQASCSNNNSWETGWIVFTDRDGDRVVDGGTDEILRVAGALGSGNTLRSTGLDNASAVQYGARGFIVDNNGDLDADGTFRVCDSRGVSKALAVNINDMGQINRATDSDTDGTLNDVDGNNIACP